MAKPVRGSLRPAPRPGGLTSPDPVTAPANGPARPPRPLSPDQKDHRKAAAQAGGGTPTPATTRETPRAQIRPKMIYRNSSVDPG